MPQDFNCDSLILEREDYIDITKGDVLGVTLTIANRVLPVVSDSSRLLQEQARLLSAPISAFIPEIINSSADQVELLTDRTIHVTATLGKGLLIRNSLLIR